VASPTPRPSIPSLPPPHQQVTPPPHSLHLAQAPSPIRPQKSEDAVLAAIDAENRAIAKKKEAARAAKADAARPRGALAVRPGAGPPAAPLALPSREQLGLSEALRARHAALLQRSRDLRDLGVRLSAPEGRTLLDMPPMDPAELQRHGRGRYAPSRQREVRVQAVVEAMGSGTQTDEVPSARLACQAPEDLGIDPRGQVQRRPPAAAAAAAAGAGGDVAAAAGAAGDAAAAAGAAADAAAAAAAARWTRTC